MTDVSHESRKTTMTQANDVLESLTQVRKASESLDVISPAYLKMIDRALTHLRVRVAKEEWK